MAEHDGSGFPLSYCLLSTASSVQIGKRTEALTAWATRLRDTYGVNPVFAHVDKDMAEIGMLQDVRRPKIQLCWWHTKSAVEDHPAKSKLSTTPYNEQQAQSEFSFISASFVPSHKADPTEHEGGTGGTCDHTGIADIPLRDSPNAVTLHIPIPPHLHEPFAMSKLQLAPITTGTVTPTPSPELIPILQSTATSLNNSDKLTIKLPAKSGKENRRPELHTSDIAITSNANNDDKHTFCPVEHRQPIISMIERHYCAHPLILGYSSLSPEGIREWAVKQMYSYCVDHDLREVWAYLWENWYRPGRWDLWARSCHPEIAILKTTMILESQ